MRSYYHPQRYLLQVPELRQQPGLQLNRICLTYQNVNQPPAFVAGGFFMAPYCFAGIPILSWIAHFAHETANTVINHQGDTKYGQERVKPYFRFKPLN